MRSAAKDRAEGRFSQGSSATPDVAVGNHQRKLTAADVARCVFPVPQWSKAVLPISAKPLSLAQRRVEATAVLAPQTLRPLSELQVGQQVLLPLADGEIVQGVVNLKLTNDAGWVRVGGAFVGGGKGEFSLAQKIDEPLQWAGQILHDDRQVGYELSSTAGSLRLNRKPLDSMICQGMPRAPGQPPSRAADAGGATTASVAAAPPALDSKPDAVGVLYLDFDGEMVTDPGWNGGATILAQPAVMGSYAISNAQITEVWQRVAEDFKPFNVTVTTVRARYDSAPVGARVLCIITPTDSWYPRLVGGVAKFRGYRGPAAGHSSTVPCWVFNNSNPSVMALTVSHELGHMVDLSHDGTTSLTYYGGHDTGEVSWGPIMGAPWYCDVTQWSIGEYDDANNQEDDFDIVASVIAEPFGGSGYVTDEAGGSIATAAELDVVGTVNRGGIIDSQNDDDYYELTTAGGALNITCQPAIIDPNLDAQLTLYNQGGTLIATAATQAPSLAANISTTLVTGTYYLAVRGKGRADTAFNQGYSRYGSAGAYTLKGSYVPLPALPSFTQQPVALTTVNQGGRVTLSVKTLSHTKVTYQWRKNGADMPGKTADSLVLLSAQPGDATTYTVLAKNIAGETLSDPAVVAVNYKPYFTVQPLPAKSTIAAGSGITFSVNAIGSSAVSWQWRKNGLNLSGKTDSTLTLTNVGWFDAGSYTVVATNSWGSTTSLAAALTVTSAPVFVAQPPTLKPVANGGTAVVAPTVVGTAPITYQWFKGTDPIPGAIKSTYGWTKAGPAIEGTYFLRATNPHGFADSIAMVVDVQDKPVITLHPQATTNLNADDSLTLQCAATGTETLTYQWQLNGINVVGANAATLSISPVSWVHRGTYRCVVSNAVGSVFTKNAVVSLVSYAVIVTPPVDTKIAKGGTGVLKVVAGGTPILKYQWMKDGIDIPKATGTALVLAKASPTTTPGSYSVRVTNLQSTVPAVSSAAAVTVEDPPVIVQQPLSVSAPFGGDATFTVAATGSPTLRYQWQRNNVNILGATTASLALTDVQAINTASYRVIVSNDVGTVASATVKLSVLSPPSVVKHPVGQVLYAYDTVTFSVVAAGSATLRYQWRKNGDLITNSASIAGATTATLKLTSIQADHAGSYTVEVSNAVGTATSNAATLQVNPVPLPTFTGFSPQKGRVGARFFVTGTNFKWVTGVTVNGRKAAFVYNRDTELSVTVPVGATSGLVEVTTRGGVAASTTAFMVVGSTIYPNDHLINAQVINSSVFGSSNTYSNNAAATYESPEAAYVGKTIWFHWRAPLTASFEFNTGGTPFANVLYLYTGPPIPDSYSALEYLGFSNGSSYGYPTITYRVTKGTDYYLCLDSRSSFFTDDWGNTLLNIYRVVAFDSARAEGSATDAVDSLVADIPPSMLKANAAPGTEVTPSSGSDQRAFVGGESSGNQARVAWFKTDEVATDATVSATVDLSIDTVVGTQEQFSWTLFDKAGTAVFALSFDCSSAAIQSQIAGQPVAPTGQVFVPGAKYELTFAVDYALGTWGAMLNGSWIIENQALPASAITSGFGDVGAVWMPAPGATTGGKMHFDNLSIESRPSAK